MLRAFLAAKELRYSRGTQLVLAVLTKNGSTSDLGERLRREGLLPGAVTVVTLGRHDQQLEAALGEGTGSAHFRRLPLVSSEGLRPSDSPARALARRFAGALPPPREALRQDLAEALA